MSEIAARADFSRIRYAQCWEDADVLLAGLAVRPGDVCLSIASAGDNSLALLTADPARVIAVDLSESQLHCVALRIAAYRCLAHHQMLELIGSRRASARQRLAHYRRCRSALPPAARRFWDERGKAIATGIGGCGKFENYFRLFRRLVLPWVHRRSTVRRLLQPRPPARRRRFYDRVWDNAVWQGLFRLFFSRRVMGRAGRDPAFFRYVEGSVGERILGRTRHALRELDPAANPYLHWILRGRHGARLPLALREEHFATIRDRLDRLELRQAGIETVLDAIDGIDRANCSDIFEYMSDAGAQQLLGALADRLRPGGRLLYWNMLVPRQAGPALSERLRACRDEADALLRRDQAWFYSRLVIEERSG